MADEIHENQRHPPVPRRYKDLGDGTYAHVVALEPNSVGGATPTYAVRLDEPSVGVTYAGEAVVGTAGSAASWRIKRITESGTTTVIEYADGDTAFDNIWDNRASLTYS